jgi:uncharacterized metal-binding protein
LSAILYGLPFAAYRERPEVNKSLLDLVAVAPAKARAYLDGADQEQTVSMLLGTAVHCATNEPEKLVCIPRFDKRTKQGKADAEEYFGNITDHDFLAVEEDVFEKAHQIASSVKTHPRAKALLDKGSAEVTVISELDGVPVKCRVDWMRDNGLLVDLKTTQDASPEGFARSVAKYRYHVQCALYTDACRSAGVDVRSFVFVAVETKPPYLVACYMLDPLDIERGRTQYRRDLATYRECVESGTWKGYSDDIKVLELPAWARMQQPIGEY